MIFLTTSNMNIQYKDALFRDVFKDKTRLLSLYNCISGSQYSNPNDIQLNTLNTVLSNGLRNDVSFTLQNKFIVLLEHQSTLNNNMPLRCLFYVAKLYQDLIDSSNLYREKLISLPSPDFYVLYNGDKPHEAKKLMCLSEAFGSANHAKLELQVTSYNINYDKNNDLLTDCTALHDYSFFVHKAREYKAAYGNKDSILKAIDYCIKKDVMRDYLLKRYKEVVDMVDFEWNLNDALRVRGEEAREEGIAEGMKKGIEKGMEKGMERKTWEIVVNLLGKKYNLSLIADATNLSFDKIKEIAKNNNIKIAKSQLSKPSVR